MKLIGFRHMGLGGKISRKTKLKKTKSGLPIPTFSKLSGRISVSTSKRLIVYDKRDLKYIKNELRKSGIKYELYAEGGGGGGFVYVFKFEKDPEVSISFEMNSIHTGIEILIKRIGEKDRNKYCSLQYIGYDEDGYYDDNGNLCIAKEGVVEQTFKEDKEVKSIKSRKE